MGVVVNVSSRLGGTQKKPDYLDGLDPTDDKEVIKRVLERYSDIIIEKTPGLEKTVDKTKELATFLKDDVALATLQKLMDIDPAERVKLLNKSILKVETHYELDVPLWLIVVIMIFFISIARLLMGIITFKDVI